MREVNPPKGKQSASDDFLDKEDSRHPVFSPQDVMQFQMIEGTRESSQVKQSVHQGKQEIPDMSVGWYASPQDDDLMD